MKINDVKVTGILNSKIKISGNFYPPLSAIFHYGLTVNEGNYTAIFRKNKWLLANYAEIKETIWPTGAKYRYASTEENGIIPLLRKTETKFNLICKFT